MEYKAVNNLNGGEVSPYLYGRDDIPQLYNKSCLQMENFIPLPYGGATKRTGTEEIYSYTSELDSNGNAINEEKRILPFEFNSNEAYILIFKHKGINIVKNNYIVTQAGDEINGTGHEWHQSKASITENPDDSSFYYCTLTDGTDPSLSDVTSLVVDGNIINVSEGDELEGDSPCFFIKNPSVIEPTEQTGAKPNVNTVYLKASFFPNDPDSEDTGFVQKLTSNIFELASPYSASDLKDIKFVQSADVVFLVHPNYAPRTISRISDTNWVSEELEYSFPPLNDAEEKGLTMTTTVSQGSTVLTSNKPYFNRNMEGENLVFNVPRSIKQTSITTPSNSLLTVSNVSKSINVSNTNWTFTTGGNWLGRVQIEQSTDNGVNWTPYLTIIDTFGLSFDARENKAFTSLEPEGNNVFIRVRYTYYSDENTGLTGLSYVLTPENPEITSLVKITRFSSSTEVEAVILSAFQNSLEEYNQWVKNNGYSVGDLVFNLGGLAQTQDAVYTLKTILGTNVTRPIQYGFGTDAATDTANDTLISNLDSVEGMDYGGPGGTLSVELSDSPYSWTTHGTHTNLYKVQNVANHHNRPYLNYPNKVFKQGNIELTEATSLSNCNDTTDTWYWDVADGTPSNDHYTLYVNVGADPSTLSSLNIELTNEYLFLVASESNFTSSSIDQVLQIHHSRRINQDNSKEDFFSLRGYWNSWASDSGRYVKDVACNGGVVAVLGARKFYVDQAKRRSHPSNAAASRIAIDVTVLFLQEYNIASWDGAMSYANRQWYSSRQDMAWRTGSGGRGGWNYYNASANDTPRSLACISNRYVINMVRDLVTTGMAHGYNSSYGFSMNNIGTYALGINTSFTSRTEVPDAAMRDVIFTRDTDAFRTGATDFEGNLYYLDTLGSDKLQTATSEGVVINTESFGFSNPTNPTGLSILMNTNANGLYQEQQLWLIDSNIISSDASKLYMFNFAGTKKYYECLETVTANDNSDFIDQLDLGKWRESVGEMDDIQRGAFSSDLGFPSAITIFENRLVFGGSLSNPGTIYLSATDDYNNFKTSTLATASMRLTINSGKLDVIEWFMPHEDLIIGCSGSEWTLGSESDSLPISPSQFSIRRRTTYGSSTLPAVLVNSAILFYMRNLRKLRQWTFNYEAQDYSAEDLSIVAEHITKSGIKSIAYQQSPDTMIWSVRNDGELIGLTYERDQQVVGWHRHKVQANFGGFQVLGNFNFNRAETDTSLLNWTVTGETGSNTITINGDNKATWNYRGSVDTSNLAMHQSTDSDGQGVLKIGETYIAECYVSRRYSDNEMQFLHITQGSVLTRLPIQPGLNRCQFTATSTTFNVKRAQLEDGVNYSNKICHIDMTSLKVFNKNRFEQSAESNFIDVAVIPSENNEDQVYAVNESKFIQYDAVDETKRISENNITEEKQLKCFVLKFQPRDYGGILKDYAGMDYTNSFNCNTNSTEAYLDKYKGAVGFEINVVVDGVNIPQEDYNIKFRNTSNVETDVDSVFLQYDDYIVFNDGIIDTTNGSKVHVGIKYIGTVAPIYFSSSKIGSKGLKVNAPFANIQFKDTVEVKAGQSVNKDNNNLYKDLEPVKFSTSGNDLKNGFAEVHMKSASDYLQTVYIVADGTTPVEVTSMMVKMTEGDL